MFKVLTFPPLSETPLTVFADSTFVATLFTSDADKVMRYTDEGEMTELCKWTVDLSSLPTFRQNATMPQSGGFYTGNVPQRISGRNLSNVRRRV